MFGVTTDKQTCPVGEIFYLKKHQRYQSQTGVSGKQMKGLVEKSWTGTLYIYISLMRTHGYEDTYIQIAWCGVFIGGDLRSSLDRF